MNLFKTVLSAEHVLVNADIANKQVLFETVAQLVESTRGIARSKVFDSLQEREKLASTRSQQSRQRVYLCLCQTQEWHRVWRTRRRSRESRFRHSCTRTRDGSTPAIVIRNRAADER
jgi:hypothetical protein